MNADPELTRRTTYSSTSLPFPDEEEGGGVDSSGGGGGGGGSGGYYHMGGGLWSAELGNVCGGEAAARNGGMDK